MSTRTPHPRRRIPDTQIASDRRETVLGIAVLLLAAAVIYLSTAAIDGSPLDGGTTLRVPLPDGSPIVRAGDPVRIGGRRTGQVRKVALNAQGSGAVATIELTGGAKVGPDASARVRLKGLAGATYLELTPGDTARPLRDGQALRAGRVQGAAQLADVVAAFDAATRRGLARTTTAMGEGLAGRGTTLNHTLAALAPTARATAPLLRAMTPQPGTLTVLVDGAARLADDVAGPDLRALLPAARGVLTTTGAGAGDLGAAVDALPGLERQAGRTLPRADALLADLRGAATDLGPGVRALRAALPALRRAEGRAAGLADLAAVGRRATPVVRLTVPVALQLRGTATGLGAATAPVATLSDGLVPYRHELVEAPAGFTRWGGFRYDQGQAAGSKAVRFSMVFTCSGGRSPYGAPGSGPGDRKACP